MVKGLNVVGYKKAVQMLAMAQLKSDMFERSTILTMLYGRPKNKTLNDLLAFRQKVFNIPGKLPR